jgi:hypothetical protein
VVEDVETRDGRLAVGGRHVTGDDPHGRGLAGAVWTEKTKDFARLCPKTHIVNGGKRAVFLKKVLDLDHEGSPENRKTV